MFSELRHVDEFELIVEELRRNFRKMPKDLGASLGDDVVRQ